MSFNLAVMLREAAISTPGSPALLYDGGRMTFGELDGAAGRMACGLRRAGLGRGDPIAIMMPNIPQFVIAYFAVLKIGAVAVPLNVLLRAPEIEHALTDSGARVLLVWSGVAGEALAGVQRLDQSIPVYATAATVAAAPEAGITERALPYEELLDAEYERDIVPTEPGDTAVVIYTSGTTGRPKGAELSHIQLFMCCDIGGRVFGLRSDDVVCAVLPLFHAFGLTNVLNVSVRYGASISLIPRFDPETVLRAMDRDGITIFTGVPTMFTGLLAHPEPERFDTGALRIAVSGGAAMPAQVMQDFEARFGALILEGYGMTETAAMACFNRSAQERRVMSIGKPFWGVEMRIVDDKDRELPVGPQHIGEIVLRGYNVMKGYRGAPEATAESFRNGWFHTGDLAYLDEDGFFFIVDRKKELIIRGGYDVYPREVEDVLYAHPDVGEAAVIGVPHERLGEEVVAVISTVAGAYVEEGHVIGWCRERLAAYKYPRKVVVLDDLPKNAIGKVLKTDLAARLGDLHVGG